MTARRLSHAVLAVVLATGAATPSLVGAQGTRASSRTDPLDRAVSAWAKVRTVRATFEQTIANPLTGGTLRASGEYQQQRPSKLSVRFNDPSSDRIVADGKYVWLYLPSTAPGQVIRSTQRESGTGTVDVSAQFLTAPRARYLVTSTGTTTTGGRTLHGYTLVPKARERAPFTKAVVLVDASDATIRQFTVTETNGVERTVRLTSFRTNVPVQASAFVFTPPAGTRVVAR